MCECKNIRIGSFENQSIVINPFNGKKVSVDRCILPEVYNLWAKGVNTIGSCCGHNKTVPTIVVSESESCKMQALGYKKLYCPFNKQHLLIQNTLCKPLVFI